LIGGTVKSAIGIGNLLWAGIGDTIRVSLSAEPEEEVRVGYEILKTLGLRTRGVRVVSCPSCARQGFDVIRTVQKLEDALQHIKTPMSLSVLGCVVNGPGEARETDIGITGGGNGKHMVYLSGVTDHHVADADMIAHIVQSAWIACTGKLHDPVDPRRNPRRSGPDRGIYPGSCRL
jgi:(E)-4-hydroxy-3-methylbut-2-enyl-diphosphate synthase